uniref:Putative ovule protein n=1 Tax=Solanum chacoense TaxID=4108 RepID=A0A0V0HL80_SOLCH
MINNIFCFIVCFMLNVNNIFGYAKGRQHIFKPKIKQNQLIYIEAYQNSEQVGGHNLSTCFLTQPNSNKVNT